MVTGFPLVDRSLGNPSVILKRLVASSSPLDDFAAVFQPRDVCPAQASATRLDRLVEGLVVAGTTSFGSVQVNFQKVTWLKSTYLPLCALGSESSGQYACCQSWDCRSCWCRAQALGSWLGLCVAMPLYCTGASYSCSSGCGVGSWSFW